MRVSAFALIVSLVLLAVPPADAHVTKIVIDKKISPAFNGQSFGPAGQYETLSGRAFGELDPNDSHNAIITDIKLAPRNAKGKVEYVASFFLVKPLYNARVVQKPSHPDCFEKPLLKRLSYRGGVPPAAPESADSARGSEHKLGDPTH